MFDETFDELFAFIRQQYPGAGTIPLHAPLLGELEKRYLCDCIDSSYVSSIGERVGEFEQSICRLSGRRYAVATVNGTAALQLSARLAGVSRDSEVIISPLTFIATANAVSHCGARPVFVDIERQSLAICPLGLRNWLHRNSRLREGRCVNNNSGRIIKACICTHVFGHPAPLAELLEVCADYGLALIEDAAEALGSYHRAGHVGSHGLCTAFSFNGNKIITTGGGGALVTDDENLACRARHLATTAKTAHAWDSRHDSIGYNFRMPNINAALGCAQLERFSGLLRDKRDLAMAYRDFMATTVFDWVDEPPGCHSNFWLNALLCRDREQRDGLLDRARQQRIQLRPAWQLLADSIPYAGAEAGDLSVARDLVSRLVTLPSSARLPADA